MTINLARAVESLPFDGPDFSICSLVTSDAHYQRMCASFAAGGFTPHNAEFMFADNRTGNVWDGYRGLNALMARAKGRYIICCHQDVELIGSGAKELKACLEALSQLDPDWGVAGNAGYGTAGVACHISDPYGDDQHAGNLPAEVYSLDENFLVFRAEARIGFSHDLHGFHLYGTDACLQAELRGMKAYVIDFHLRHHGRGTVDRSYFECLRRLEAKYGRAFRSRSIKTPVKTVYLTASFLQSFFWRGKKKRRERMLSRRKTDDVS